MIDISAWGYDEVSALLHRSPEWHERRRGGIGGGDAGVIMNGDADELIQLWREKRGEVAPPDLSHVLPVLVGIVTEPLNRYLFQRDSGRTVTHAGESFASEQYPWMRMTADGLTRSTSGPPAVFEAKTVNAFTKMNECIQRYQPQLHHQMVVAGVEWSVLSVLVGTQTYECVEVALDPWYASELCDREQLFWECVESGVPPVEMPPVPTPVPPSQWRTIDLTGNNTAAINGPLWLETLEFHKAHLKADKELKLLLEADVGEAIGYGVCVKRDKAGRLRIVEAKS